MLTLNRNIQIEIPTRPTSITIEKIPLNISNFNEEELTRIGAAWTEKLIAEATELRKKYDKRPKTKLDK